MDAWINLVVGDLILPNELLVFVRIVGVLFLLEIATFSIAILSGLKR